MRIIFEIRRLLPKTAKQPWVGALDCDAHQLLRVYDAVSIIAEMHRVEIVYIGPGGITFKGYEPGRVKPNGVQEFNYQEWHCIPIRLEET